MACKPAWVFWFWFFAASSLCAAAATVTILRCLAPAPLVLGPGPLFLPLTLEFTTCLQIVGIQTAVGLLGAFAAFDALRGRCWGRAVLEILSWLMVVALGGYAVWLIRDGFQQVEAGFGYIGVPYLAISCVAALACLLAQLAFAIAGIALRWRRGAPRAS